MVYIRNSIFEVTLVSEHINFPIHFYFGVPQFYFLIFNYILLFMLLQLSWFSPSTQHPSVLQAIPTPLFMYMGHMYKFFGYSVSYTVLYIPMAIL